MTTPTTRRGALSLLAGTVTVGCIGDRGRRDLDRAPSAIFRGDLRRRGYRATRSVPASIRLDWRLDGVNTGEHTAAKASPIRSPTGDVIAAGDTGDVISVTSDGDVSWRAATASSTRGIHGTPVIANGVAYVGAYDGALYAFDVATGRRRWRTKLGDAIGSSPAYHAGTVFVAVEFYAPSGSVYAVDAATGRVTWEDSWPSDHPHSSIAIDPSAGRLVVGANDGGLFAWTYPGLERAWRVRTGGPIKGPVAIHDGAAFVGSWDGRVYRVSLDRGRVDWSVATGGRVMSGPGIDPERESVIVGSHDGRVYALALDDGERHWSAATDGRVIGCPTLTDRHAVVGSYDRHVYAIDRATGDVAWRAPAAGWVTSTPLVTRDAVYVTDRAAERDGGLYRFVAAE